ncbi:MAG TPA: hypothetical protein VF624_10565 [Tepidisphaeraceae bacterium]|jgi:hypothetical protein
MSATVPTAPTPIVEPAAARALPLAVLGTFAATAAALSGIVALSGKPGWWPALAAATAVAFAGAIASVAVLRRAAGKRVDEAVTLAMAASLVRIAVSAVGVLVAVKTLGPVAEATGFMICGYYAVTLAAETVLLSRAAGGHESPLAPAATDKTTIARTTE